MKLAVSAAKINDAEVLSLNANLIVKDDYGLYFPSVGCVGKMVACVLQKQWNHLGKNSEIYNSFLLKKFENIQISSIAVLSDDIFTDLIPFKKQGFKNIFITTGKYNLKDFPDGFNPDIVVSSLKEVMEKEEVMEKIEYI